MANKENEKYTIFETFVGAGGSHIGFMEMGFKSVYVNDFEENCLEALKYNHPQLIKDGTYIDNRSIIDVDPFELRRELQVERKEIDVMFGGVVCKGFSLAGERNPNDARSYLYLEQLKLVEEFLPKISIIENVKGMINAKILDYRISQELKNEIDEVWLGLERYKGQKSALRKKDNITEEFIDEGKKLREKKIRLVDMLEDQGLFIGVMDDLIRRYEQLGYNVKYDTLNSAWYGAATKRERLIVVAVRNDIDIEFNFPKPEYMDKSIFVQGMEKDFLNLPKPLTVNQAFEKIDYKNLDDIDNKPMNHRSKTIERFKYIQEGRSIADNMDEVPDHLKISNFYSRGATMRLDGNSPSPTLVPGHSNFPVHPQYHRSITVREAASITGFPLAYKFFGSHAKRCEHVGNAVPPPLARAVAQQCIAFLDEYYEEMGAKNKR